MTTGKIALVDDAGYVTRMSPPSNTTGADREIELPSRQSMSKVASNVLQNTSSLAIDNTLLTKNFSVVTYTGNGATQSITTGINSVDFTVANNGSGYWLDRTVNQVKNDAGTVVVSGSTDWGTNKGVSKVHIKDRKFNNGAPQGEHIVMDGLRGEAHIICTDTTSAEFFDNPLAFNSTGITLLSNFSRTNSNINLDNYILYQTLYTHIKWGLTSQGKFYVEAYNPVTKEGMIYYIGSGSKGHEIPHSMGVEIDWFAIKQLTQSVHWRTYIGDENSAMSLDTDAAPSVYTWYGVQTKDAMVLGDHGNINGIDEKNIAYYKCKSETWTIGTYTGTGASGNKIVTKDVNGVIRRPSRIIIKSINAVGDWLVFDNIRGAEHTIQLDLPNAEDTVNRLTFESYGMNIIGVGVGYNKLNGKYLYIVEFDTQDTGTPDGSYFPYPTSTSNLTITDGKFQYTNGKDKDGFVLSSELVPSATVPLVGVTDGYKWLGRKEVDGTFIAEDLKPQYSMYEKLSANDNRMVMVDGKWYDTTGGELVTNGRFDTDISGWTFTQTGTTSSATWSNGQVNLVSESGAQLNFTQQLALEVGKEYTVQYDNQITTGNSAGFNISSDGTDTGNYASQTMVDGTNTFTFIAQGIGDYINIVTANGRACLMDNISVYKSKPTLGTVQPAISFFKNRVMVTNEVPQSIDYTDELIENYMDSLEVTDVVADSLDVTNANVTNANVTNMVVANGFDLGQQWVDETANRAVGVTYTNNTGKPIMVMISVAYTQASSTNAPLIIDGVNSINPSIIGATASNLNLTVTSIVPNGSTYKMDATTGSTINIWSELK